MFATRNIHASHDSLEELVVLARGCKKRNAFLCISLEDRLAWESVNNLEVLENVKKIWQKITAEEVLVNEEYDGLSKLAKVFH